MECKKAIGGELDVAAIAKGVNQTAARQMGHIHFGR